MSEVKDIAINRGVVQAVDLLQTVSAEYPLQTVFSTSFSLEDQIITDLIFSNNLPITVFTLDTGRLFPETYSAWSATLDRYKDREIVAYYPDAGALQEYVSTSGPNGFYDSIQQRLACCKIRKVDPLQQALAGKRNWITGIRREHSPNRSDMTVKEWDAKHELCKYHPLLEWSDAMVQHYIQQYALPYNVLHDRGFPSIGCQPCTRPVKRGEDMRAGRWWWESNDKKECGLHISMDKNR